MKFFFRTDQTTSPRCTMAEYAVELYFDRNMDQRVRKIVHNLARMGLPAASSDPNWRPHITLAVYEDIPDREELVRRVGDFARRCSMECARVRDRASDYSPLNSAFSSLGIFPSVEGVLYLSPLPTSGLFNTHSLYHAMTGNLGHLERGWYLPDRWVPHCTLATGVETEDLGRAAETLAGDFPAAPFVFSSVGVISFSPVDRIATFPIANLCLKSLEEGLERCEVTRQILESLPDWFGIPEAIDNYCREVEEDPHFLVWYDADTPVGFISCCRNTLETMEIRVMGLKQDYHRMGLGRRMVLEAAAMAAEEGCGMMMVKTLGESRSSVHYDGTRNFYRGIGFTALQETTRIWGPENPCLIMAMALE